LCPYGVSPSLRPRPAPLYRGGPAQGKLRHRAQASITVVLLQSPSTLATLAIIAYQQPVTRPQVDAVRGVNSDPSTIASTGSARRLRAGSVMHSLLSKGLIQEGGRAEGPGRPILYSTTPEFLQHFGLNSLNELPPLEREENGTQDVTLLKG
jgi:segregation and condensation protein B